MSDPAAGIPPSHAAGPSHPSDRSNVQFPWRLHELLTEAQTNGNEVIISWLPETNAFKVHNKARFTTEILPAYFNATKYKSFQRNLNLWGFESIQEGPHKGGCFHPLFLRGDRERCHYMTRQKVKGNQGKQNGGIMAHPKPTGHHPALVANHKASLSALADLASQATNTSFAAAAIKTDESRLPPASKIDDLRALSFPMKLHHFLAQTKFVDCICWTPDGRCIRVVDPFKFQEQVAVAYFSHTSFSSFLVELESYGFKKVSHGGFQECYYHDLTIRGCPHLSKYMRDPETSRKFRAEEPEKDLKVDPAFGVPTIIPPASTGLGGGGHSLSQLNGLLGPGNSGLLAPDAAGALVQEIQQRQHLAALQLMTAPQNSNSSLGVAFGLGGLGTSFLGAGVAAAARRASLPGSLSLATTNPGALTGGGASAREHQGATKTPIANMLANSSQANSSQGSSGGGRLEAV